MSAVQTIDAATIMKRLHADSDAMAAKVAEGVEENLVNFAGWPIEAATFGLAQALVTAKFKIFAGAVRDVVGIDDGIVSGW
jgi:hypothetical protein